MKCRFYSSDGEIQTGFDVPDLDRTDPAFSNCCHRKIDTLRKTDPIHQDKNFDRVVLTRAGDIARVLADGSFSVDPYKARMSAYSRMNISLDERRNLSMIEADDPDHSRLRRPFVKMFTPKALGRRQDAIERMAKSLMSDITDCEPCDIIAYYVRPLVSNTLASIVTDEQIDIDNLCECTKEIINFIRGCSNRIDFELYKKQNDHLDTILNKIISRKKISPGEDLISHLLSTTLTPDGLSESEIRNSCRQLVTISAISTIDLIGNGILALLDHPDELSKLRSDSDKWSAAVEEILRWNTPVRIRNRQCLDDNFIGDHLIKRGQTIASVLIAANHDPELHSNPHEFNIDREEKKHFSFGGGAHFCLGASLVRILTQIALREFFDRSSSLSTFSKEALMRMPDTMPNRLPEIYICFDQISK